MVSKIAAVIFSLSIVGRQIFEFARKFIPLSSLKIICSAIALAAVLIVFYIGYRKGLKQLIILFWLFPAAYVASLMVVAPQEQLHFVLFGLLGIFALRTMPPLKALATVVVVSINDELVQALLPYRFFEVRDILLNLVGSSIGLAIGYQLFIGKNK